jgi:hypothetical protein
MKTFCVASLLAALSLGGCCSSSVSCNAPLPVATGNWDGLGQPPTDDRSPPAKKRVSHNQTKAKGEDPTSAQRYATGDDLQYDDDRLKQKLVICRGCGTHGDSTTRNKSVTSVPRDWNSD